MSYKNLNDYELIYQVRENDEVAYGLLMEKYSNLVRILAKKILKNNKNLGLEYDDLYQEGMVGVIKALNDYNSDNTLFFTYASLCAQREMDRIIKYHKRKKIMVLNDSISLNMCINKDPNCTLEDFIPSEYNLEKNYENIEEFNKLMDIKYDFDLLDSSIYELKLNGFSTREIATLMELSYKAVDYRLRKMRKKILKYSY